MTKHRQGQDAELNAIASTIRNRVRNVAALNQSGDYSEIMTWLIPGKLACGARPLRYHHIYGGSGKDLPAQARPALDEWIKQVKQEGIVSIICFMSDKELAHYKDVLPDHVNLIDYYRAAGFHVRHVPWSDPAHTGYANFSEEVKEKRPVLLAAYDELPKPVLVHCSAAIDRAPPVLAYVVSQRNETI